MASIEKRISKDGDTSYRVKVIKKGFPIETATFAKLTDAKAWAATIEAAIKEGRHFKIAPAKQHTLSELIQAYTPIVSNRNKTAARTLNHLAWWDEQLGYITLDRLNSALIGEYRDKLLQIPIQGRTEQTQRSGPTVNRYLAALSAACQFAVKEKQWLETNPVHRVVKFKESQGREVFLTQEQVVEVMDACKEHGRADFYLFILLLLTTGARASEIELLRWEQVKFDQNIIVLKSGETKNDKSRSLHLLEPALSVMRTYAEHTQMGNPLVFPNPNDPTKTADLDGPWKRLRVKLGMEHVRRHDFRHTSGAFLAMSGAGVRDIMDILGHKTPAMAMRYSHLLEEHKALKAHDGVAMMFAKAPLTKPSENNSQP